MFSRPPPSLRSSQSPSNTINDSLTVTVPPVEKEASSGEPDHGSTIELPIAENSKRPYYPAVAGVIGTFGFGGNFFLLTTGTGMIKKFPVHDLVDCSIIIDYPGPLGMNVNKDVVPFLQKKIPCAESQELVVYLEHLLASSDPTKTAFLVKPSLSNNSIETFFLMICMGDLSSAVNCARSPSAPKMLWPFVLSIIGSTRQFDVIDFAASSFADQVDSQLSSEMRDESDTDKLLIRVLVYLIKCLTNSEVSLPDDVIANWKFYVSVLVPYTVGRPNVTSHLREIGDKLIANHQIYRGHLCYILAGKKVLDPVDSPNALIALLGVNHKDPTAFRQLLEAHSFILSEVLEYAVRELRNADCFPSLQPFKYAYACYLADFGFTDRARKYISFVNAFLQALPATNFSRAFRTQLKDFEKRLSGTIEVQSNDNRLEAAVSNSIRGLLGGIKNVANSLNH